MTGNLPSGVATIPIDIGGNLTSAGQIIVPASGLRSHVLINSANLAASWLGAVRVGGLAATPLVAPAYPMGYQGIDEFVAAIMNMPTHERDAEVQRLGQMLMQGSGLTE